MKKAVAVILLFVFSAAVLCSCTREETEIGTWRMTLDFGENFGAPEEFSVKDLTIDYVITFKEDDRYEMSYDFEKFEKDFKEAAKTAADYAEKSDYYNKLIDNYIEKLKLSAEKSGTYFKNGIFIAILDSPVFSFKLVDGDLLLKTENGTEYTLKRQ